MSDEHLSTKLIHTRGERLSKPTVNPPVERGSTILFKDRESLYGPLPTYGRKGHAVHRELEAALKVLEDADHVRLTPNGVSACALAIASQVRSGDHILITDGLYGPTRRFCERRLKAMGVSSDRFSPRIGADIEGLFRPNTKLVVLETPSSLTFEVPDSPAIIAAAHGQDIKVMVDNTWAAGVFHKPLTLGADITIQALTKYVIGHADGFGGAVMCRDQSLAKRIDACGDDWGIALGPDEAYSALRGLRTLPVRLTAHEQAGYAIANWLTVRPEIDRVIHPGLSDHPDHALWERDFTGASGLFGAVLKPVETAQLDRFLIAMERFGMGFSWGGYESLLIPSDDQLRRLDGDWTETKAGPLLRIHAGLEDHNDLIADLEQAFEHLSNEAV